MKAVLFDFGGTIDTNGVHWSEKFWTFYARHRIHATKKDFERVFVETEHHLQGRDDTAGLSFRELLLRQFSHQFEALRLRAHDITPDTLAGECYGEVRATIDRARVLLEAYARRYRLGLVSNFYGNLEVVCREFSLDALFPVRIDSEVVRLRKPDPAIFALALERLEVEPAAAWVVGDSYQRDIVPAKVLGCSTIWLKGQSWTVPKETESADYTITTLEAARAILLP